MIYPLITMLFFTYGAEKSDLKVIHAGQLIIGNENKVRGPSTIEIKDNKIIKVSKGYKDIAGAEHINLTDSTVLPGLMDMHTHLSVTFNKNTYIDKFKWNEGDYAIHAVASARKTLLAGFTTVRDLGDAHNVTITLKKAIGENKVIGPRIYTAGKSIATTGGHADPTNGHRYDEMDFPGPERGVINGPTEARAAVRQRYKDGADVIKITATGGVLSTAKSGQNPQFMEDELTALMKTAKDYGFVVAAHAHGKEGMIRAIKAGIDSIEHGTFMDEEVAAYMKKHDTWYVPTITAGRWVAEKSKIDGFFPEIVRPKAALIGPKIQSAFKLAYKKGVKIAFGTDSGVSPHGENADEFVYMVEAGMPPLAAIRAATEKASQLLKIDGQVGTVEAGKWADLIAVKADPSKDISTLKNISFVMKDGVVYKNAEK